MNCFLCGKDRFELAYTTQTKRIIKCKEDGLFLSENIIKNKIYGKGYFENNPHPAQSNQDYFLKKIEIIKKLTKKSKPRILDVGCGWGDFEEFLEKEKIPYLGIDVSKEAIEICRKKGLNCMQLNVQLILSGGGKGRDPASAQTRLPARQVRRYSPPVEHLREGIFRQNLTKLKYDAITMFQVIEHLKNPLPTLQLAKKLLQKNGVILITTPNNDSPLRKILGPKWSVYNESSHYVFFSRKTLRKTLEKAGFTSINVRTDSLRFLSSRYILNRLIQISARSPLTTIYKLLTTFNLPIPTDPFGDLEALGSV